MKIVEEERMTCEYRNIVWGKCFRFNGVIWMRIKNENQSVDLGTGEIGSFTGDCPIEPLKVVLHVGG